MGPMDHATKQRRLPSSKRPQLPATDTNGFQSEAICGIITLMSRITIATANTHYGRMLCEPGGFAAVQHADVLLMQEVAGLPEDAAANLQKAGFELQHASPDMGLAIAVHVDSEYVPVEGSEFTDEIQAANRKLQTLVERHRPSLAHRFRARGLIALKLASSYNDAHVTVATTHPIVPLRFRARAAQVRAMGGLLGQEYFEGPFVLGGDMNHYPGPNKVDREVAVDAGLARVDLGDTPTWRIRGSNNEWLGWMMSSIGGQSIDSFDGQLDTLLYRGAVERVWSSVEDISSDHRAIVADFEL